ncbi:MAG: hypothetical protein E7Y34_02740, partial [Mycoplasma sp.]|nr:hypothetical protein [Mycoplasma sp.]
MLYNHQIIQLLKKSSHPISFDDIFNNFFYFNKSKFQLNKQLNELIDDHKIFKTNNGEYFLPNQTKETINNLDVNPKGFGFVRIKELQDKSIMIFKTQFNGALNGDLVRVVYFQDPFNKEQYQGYVK